MKKLMILAVAAIALVACSKEFDTNKSASNGTAIGFNTWAEQLTKARTPGTSTFTDGDDFAVYGYKDKSTPAPATVFDDVVVSTTDGSTWSYTTLRFWDSTYDSYTFFAISPAAIGTAANGEESSTNVNPQTGAFVTRAITFAGDDNDILVADKKTVLKTDTPVNFGNGSLAYGPVALVFNHVAALVDFKVKKASSLANATVTVSEFELSDIDNVGQLTVSDAYNSAAFGKTLSPVVSWSGTARTTYGPGDGVNDDCDISSPITVAEDTGFSTSNSTANTTPAGSTPFIKNLIVLPQTFRASNASNPQKLTLSYKISVDGSADTEFEDNVLYLADFDLIDNNAQAADFVGGWAPGKHYTFYITIDANKIDFTATITDWIAANGYHYLLN
ncbi:MAG: fimbrillin family protein [Bacteroidales bacterium]|nr:fimbrillin family protein [Bacteroidales bacterium]